MYSPALLGIDAHCGQIHRSAPPVWAIVVFGVGVRRSALQLPRYAAIAGELSLRERSRTASAVAIQPSIVVGLGARLRR